MTTITPTTVEELLDYWLENIPSKGKLVSDDGRMCAQAQALYFLDNYSLSDLRNVDQAIVDTRVAEIFGISRSHSVLLRLNNDRQDGAPSSVIRNPEQILGNQAQVVLALWRHLDRMTAVDWAAAWDVVAQIAVKETAGNVAQIASGITRQIAVEDIAKNAAQIYTWYAAGDAARIAAYYGVEKTAGNAARVAAGASCEVQGAAVMRAKNQPFFFLPLLGFSNPEAVIAANSN